MIGRLTCESEWTGRVGTSSYGETSRKFDATVRLSSDVRKRMVDRGINQGKCLSAAKRRKSRHSSVVHSLGIEKCGIRCAGGVAASPGRWTGGFALSAVLTVVASVWLLRKLLASGFQDWTRTETTRLEAHQNAMRAAESEHVCFTHRNECVIEGVCCLRKSIDTGAYSSRTRS